MTLKELEIIKNYLEDKNINFKYEKLQKYQELVFFWTDKFNLIGQNEKELFFLRHLCDILPVMQLIQIESNILDFGTGGGIPGIPLAIFMPDLKVDLNEINSKKIIFLKKCKYELNLTNVEIFEGDYNKLDLSSYENIISRAVTQIHKISDNLLMKMRKNSKLIYMKNSILENDEEGWLERNKEKILLDKKYEALDKSERRLIVLNP